MRTPLLIASVLLVAFLAGCASRPPASDGPADDTPPAGLPSKARLEYACLGAAQWSQEPCTAPGRQTFAEALAASPDGTLLAWVGRAAEDAALGSALGTGPVAPTVFTSPDGGATVLEHRLPLPPDLAPGQQWALAHASIAVSAAGTVHVVARVERDTLLVDATQNWNGANDGGIAYYRGAERGTQWTLAELDDDGAFYQSVAALPDGRLVAHWYDSSGGDDGMQAAISLDDGLTWRQARSGLDCRGGVPAVPLAGRILLACLSSIDAFTRTGSLAIASLGDDGRARVLKWGPTCAEAVLVAAADSVLLAAGDCPLLELRRSTDGTNWTHVASIDGAGLGRAGLDDAGVDLRALAVAGDLLHVIAIPTYDRGLPVCRCYDGATVHAVLRLADGHVLDHRLLEGVGDLNPTTLQFGFAFTGETGVLMSRSLPANLQAVRTVAP